MIPTRLMQTSTVGKLVAFDQNTGNLLIVHPTTFWIQSNSVDSARQEINEVVSSITTNSISWCVPYTREVKLFENYVLELCSTFVPELDYEFQYVHLADDAGDNWITQMCVTNYTKIEFGVVTKVHSSGNLILITHCNGSNCERY